MPFTWTLPDPLNITAETRSIYMTELQNATNIQRAVIGQAPLSFINQSVGITFKLSAVEELKIAVNQLALDFGYAGGVQNVDLLGRSYITITKKYGKEVCHYPILNDLRQVLNLIMVSTELVFAYVLKHPIWGRDANVANINITAGPLHIKDQFQMEFANNPSNNLHVSCDDRYIYRSRGVSTTDIYKDSAKDGLNIQNSIAISMVNGDITVDKDYLWLVSNPVIYPTGPFKINRIDKDTLGGLVQANLVGVSLTKYFYSLTNDKDYLYLLGSENIAGSTNDILIRKYDKTNLTGYTEVRIDLGLIVPGATQNTFDAGDITVDDTYLYIPYREWRVLGPALPTPVICSCIVRINKTTLVSSGYFDIVYGSDYHAYAGIVAGKDYIYLVRRDSLSQDYAVYTKAGVLQYKNDFIDSQKVDRDAQRFLACRQEYEVTLI